MSIGYSDAISEMETAEILRCQGCGTISFSLEYYCSEDDPEWDQQQNTYVHKPQITYYPNFEEDENIESFVDEGKIGELKRLSNRDFDTKRLVQMLTELNQAYKMQSYLSCLYLIRAVMDHIPPIFGQNNFSGIYNNYTGTMSFKKLARKLDDFARNQADAYLHEHIRDREVIPSKMNVDHKTAFASLLDEIIRILDTPL